MTHKEMILEHYRGEKYLAERYLEALQLLLRIYKGDYNKYTACPLCCVIPKCSDCPWHVIGGGSCTSIAEILNLGLKNQRMEEIKCWIKSYEAAVKELKEEA